MAMYSVKGYHLKGITVPYLSYKLVLDKPSMSTYLIDHNDQIDQTYLDNYKRKNWTYVCSMGSLHYFTAPVNTPRFYTDVMAKANAYHGIAKKLLLLFLGFVLLTAFSGYGFSLFRVAEEPNMPVVSALFAATLLMGMGALIMMYATITTWLKGSHLRKELHGTKDSKNQ